MVLKRLTYYVYARPPQYKQPLDAGRRTAPSRVSPSHDQPENNMEPRLAALKVEGLTDAIRSTDSDAEFGGPEERARMEKRLLRKIDRRMIIMVAIYVLNAVR